MFFSEIKKYLKMGQQMTIFGVQCQHIIKFIKSVTQVQIKCKKVSLKGISVAELLLLFLMLHIRCSHH